jgi:hypothetical protein
MVSKGFNYGSIVTLLADFIYPYHHKPDTNVYYHLIKQGLKMSSAHLGFIKVDTSDQLKTADEVEEEWNQILSNALEMLESKLLLAFKIASLPSSQRLRECKKAIELDSKYQMDLPNTTQEDATDVYLLLSNIFKVKKPLKSQLKEETYIFTSRMIYAQTFALSLAQQIALFMSTKSKSKQSSEENVASEARSSKKPKSDDKVSITKTYQLLSFDYYIDNNLLSPALRTSQRILFDIFLDELVFITIDIIRITLVFFAFQFEKSAHFFSFKWSSSLFKLDQFEQHDYWTHGQMQKMVNRKLELLIEKMTLMDLINQAKSKNDLIVSLSKEIWEGIKSIMSTFNEDKSSYLAEIRFIDRWSLYLSATFIARKYLIKFFITLVSILINFLVNCYDKEAINWEKGVKFLKIKIDLLIDTAFNYHLKDNFFSIISTIDGMVHIQSPDWSQELDQKVTHNNIYIITSKLLALISFKLIRGKNYDSPLYSHLVKKFTLEVSKIEQNKVQQINEVTKFLEKEIPFLYADLNIKYNCLEKVDQLGSLIASDLGMKRSCKDFQPIDNLSLLLSSYTR